jgi:hypothetical protein
MKRGRERRKAWIYSAINPLLDGLRIEGVFLAKGNWTFRRYNRDLDFIRPIEILVGHRSSPNLEDFLASNPSVKEKAARREAQRQELRAACAAAYDHLVANPDFQQKVDDCFRVFQVDRPGEGSRLLHPGVKQHEVMAEPVVNSGGVPDHAGIYPFWSTFRDDLMRFRVGANFEEADQAGRNLERGNDDLSLELRQVRSALGEEYDIPWASPYDEASALSSR